MEQNPTATERIVNPFMEYCGIEIETIERDHARAKVEIRPEGTNPSGFVHGGLLFTIADCAAGYTARSDGRIYVTQSSHINFIRNRNSGVIYADGHIVNRGRSVAIVRVQVTDEGGKLLADCTMDMFCVG